MNGIGLRGVNIVVKITKISIGVAGFGNVGRAFIRKIINEDMYIRDKFNIEIKVKFIADSKGALIGNPYIDKNILMRALEIPRGKVSSLPGGVPGLSVLELIQEIQVDYLIDVTPSNYVDAEPSRTYLTKAINNNINIVTANKGPLALYFKELMDLAKSKGIDIRYKACVMAGTPLIDLLSYGLLGRKITEIMGILNGTTNYILGLLEKGLSLKQAIRLAQDKGYAEPDPSLDLKGLDIAAKTSIISSTIGKYLTIKDVEIIDVIDENVVTKIRGLKQDYRIKYISHIVINGSSARAYVKLIEVTRDSPLYNVDGIMNGVLIKVADGAKIYLEGPGAGPEVTAASLLSDLLLSIKLRYHRR